MVILWVLFMSASHIKSINLKKFKCFKDFKVDSFRRVNLIGGKNNVGKTTLLEACFLGDDLSHTYMHFIDDYSEAIHMNNNEDTKKSYELLNFKLIKKLLTIKQNRERMFFFTQWLREEVDLTFLGIIDITVNNECKLTSAGHSFSIKYLLKDQTNYSHQKEISAEQITQYSKNDYYYTIYKKNHPPILNNTKFISVCNDNAIQTMIDDSKLSGKHAQVKLYLKNIFKIDNVDVIKNQVMLFQNNSYRNLSEFGDGVRHFLNIVLVLLSNEYTTIFLDEVDNGIHHSLFDRLWEIILTISKNQNIQVFAATHSQECIESYAREADKLQDKDISFIELGRNNDNKITSITYDFEAFIDEVAQDQEIRGW